MNILQKIRLVIASYFASKALESLKSALQIRATRPEDSYIYQYAPLLEAQAELYKTIAQEIAGKSPLALK